MASQGSSEYYFDDDSQFLNAVFDTVLPGDIVHEDAKTSQESEELEPPPPAQPRPPKRTYSESQEHEVPAVDDAVYGAAHFGNFGEYMRRKRAKLQIQNADLSARSQLFKGLAIYVSCTSSMNVNY